MRENDFVNVGGDEPSWDEMVALDPEDAAAIQVDPDVDDFAPSVPEFEVDPDEEDDEVADEDPDFDDDAELSLLRELGIDLDAPDGPIGGGLGIDLGIEPDADAEDSTDDEVAA